MENLFLEHVCDVAMYEGLATLVAYVIFVRISKEFDGIPPKIAEIIYAVGGTIFTVLSLIYYGFESPIIAILLAVAYAIITFKMIKKNKETTLFNGVEIHS